MPDHDLRIARPAEIERMFPFVGREGELADLKTLYDRVCLDEIGALALLTGPPGVGKSRLLAELVRRLRTLGVPTFEGTCRERGLAYQPFIDLAHAALSYMSDQGVGGERLARAAEIVAALRGQGSLFGNLRQGGARSARIGKAQSDTRRAPLGLVRDGGDQRIRFFEQVRALFADVAQTRPAVFIIHDIDLADGATSHLLSYLARTLAPAPGLGVEGDFTGLFVASIHDGAPPSWITDVNATLIRVDGLDLEAVRAFLSSEAVVRRFFESSAGVPRRLEALLEQEPRPAGDLLADRLATLSRSAARLCRALALYGRPAGATLLERLAGSLGTDDEEMSDRAAHELRACPLLVRSVVGGELRLGFADTAQARADRGAIVAAIPEVERIALHRALGEALLAGLESGDDPVACAEHLLEGQALDRAVEVALAAGETLERAFAYERAIALYARALAATSRTEVIVALEERLADLYQLIGDYARALEVVRRLAERLRDPATLARIGHLCLLRGDLGDARSALAVAKEAAEEAGDLVVHVQVLADLAETHLFAGAHDEAQRAGRTALELGVGSTEARRSVMAARNTLGKIALEKGDYTRAGACFDENLTEATANGLLFEISRAHINSGIAALRRGDYDAAESHYRAGLAAAREHGDVRHRALCVQNLGVLAQWRRDYSAALRYYQDAVAAFKRLGHRPWLAMVALDLGDLYLGVGDLDRATAMVALADRLSIEVATTSIIRENLRGRILLRRGDVAAARVAIEAALEAARRIGNKDELSLTLLHLARVELTAGEPELALERLADIPDSPPARVWPQLLVLRGEAHLAGGDLELARVDLAASERAYADLGDDEGRLQALLGSIAWAQRTGDARSARSFRQLARDLDERLRGRVPSELAARYGREPARLALLERDVERPRLVRSEPMAPIAVRPVRVATGSAEPLRRPDITERHEKIIGRSNAVVHVLEMVERVAPHDTLVLIRGESGTGKELVAEAIHEASPRRGRPFVKVNCGALVESLLLSELFGHERGAFTGAMQRRKGRFELADGGTLFLDEIGDISPSTQVALLRVLQTHEFERVGGTQPVHVDVRIVCATNRDLEQMVAAGRFREDLYYRLKGIEIDLPPLRARADDIAELVRHFTARIAEERQTTAKDVTPAAMDVLTRYGWPGNIRELENVIRSVTLFTDGQAIDARDLVEYVGAPRSPAYGVAPVPAGSASIPLPTPPNPGAEAQGDVYNWAVQNGVSLRDLKRKIELDCITQALAECGGNITRAAERLGMKRPRLSQLLKEHGLSQGRPGAEEKQ